MIQASDHIFIYFLEIGTLINFLSTCKVYDISSLVSTAWI